MTLLKIALFLLPVALTLSTSTDAAAQAEDCAAPPPDVVLCEDFAGDDPLTDFLVVTPVHSAPSGQSAMMVGVDGEQVFFRHISGFGTAEVLSASPLVVTNKRLEGDVLFQRPAAGVNIRSAAAITWADGPAPQNYVGFMIQKDEGKVYLFIVVDGSVAAQRSAVFASEFDQTYRLALVTPGPNRIRAFVDGVMLFDVAFDMSLLPTSLRPGFSGNSRGVELRFDDLLVSCLICPVDIDIKPGSFPNSINLSSGGATPVAILGSDTLDVGDIDSDSLRLGTAGVKTVGKKNQQLCRIEDVSGDFGFGPEGVPDGFDDLVCHFTTVSIVAEGGDTIATLVGNFTAGFGGAAIEGTDSVNIVP